MGWLWISLALTVVLFVVIFWINARSEDWLFGLFTGGFSAGTFFILFFGAGGLIAASVVGTHYGPGFQRPIVALSDERSNTGGVFFLGSGVIDTSAAYFFYEAGEDGSRQLHQIDADGIKVYEDATSPYVLYRGRCESNNPGLTGRGWLCSENTRVLEIHVPPQSIKTGITLGVK